MRQFTSLARWIVLAAMAAVPWMICSPAAAHTDLVNTQPGDGSVSDHPVDRVRLEFTTPVRPDVTYVAVSGPAPVRVAEPVVSGAQVEAPVAGLSHEGTYVVAYRAVAVDGHVVTGTFSFEISAAALREATERLPLTAGSTTRTADRSVNLLTAGVLGATVVTVAGTAVVRRRLTGDSG